MAQGWFHSGDLAVMYPNGYIQIKDRSKDIIISGILLKYIGRVKQYNYNIIFKLTETGATEDCFILSRDIIKRFSKNKKIDKNIINDLVDFVLYNHTSNESSNQNFNAEIVDLLKSN